MAAGVSPAAIRTVEAVTRPPGSTYLDWIADMAANATMSALRVKLADNRDPARVAALPGAADLVTSRYEPARRLLEAGLARRRDNQ